MDVPHCSVEAVERTRRASQAAISRRATQIFRKTVQPGARGTTLHGNVMGPESIVNEPQTLTNQGSKRYDEQNNTNRGTMKIMIIATVICLCGLGVTAAAGGKGDNTKRSPRGSRELRGTEEEDDATPAVEEVSLFEDAPVKDTMTFGTEPASAWFKGTKTDARNLVHKTHEGLVDFVAAQKTKSQTG